MNPTDMHAAITRAIDGPVRPVDADFISHAARVNDVLALARTMGAVPSPAPTAADDGLIPMHVVSFTPPIAPATDLGVAGSLEWIELQDLYIDPRYQRAVLQPGRKNIGRIVGGFNWSLFSPLVVAERAPGPDGRRRFAIINGQVTAIMPTYIHYARVVAGEPDALALDAACKAAGVRILKFGNGGSLKTGETLAIGTLEGCMARYGRETLITAMQCVTETGNGNAGMLNITVIKSLCYVLDANRTARDAGEVLFSAIEAGGGIRRMHANAQDARHRLGGSVTSHLVVEVRKALVAAKLEKAQ